MATTNDAKNSSKANDSAEADEETQDDMPEQQDGKRQSGQGRSQQLALSDVLDLATGQPAELLRCEPDSVSSVTPTEGGWTAEVEVVEVERVPVRRAQWARRSRRVRRSR
jgi:hypothetical protein